MDSRSDLPGGVVAREPAFKLSRSMKEPESMTIVVKDTKLEVVDSASDVVRKGETQALGQGITDDFAVSVKCTEIFALRGNQPDLSYSKIRLNQGTATAKRSSPSSLFLKSATSVGPFSKATRVKLFLVASFSTNSRHYLPM